MLTVGKIALGLCFLDGAVVLAIIFRRYPDLWKALGPSREMPWLVAAIYRVGKIGHPSSFARKAFPQDRVLRTAWLSTGILGNVAVVCLFGSVFIRWIKH